MELKRIKMGLLAVLIALAVAVPVWADNILIDPGFSDSGLSAWGGGERAVWDGEITRTADGSGSVYMLRNYRACQYVDLNAGIEYTVSGYLLDGGADGWAASMALRVRAADSSTIFYGVESLNDGDPNWQAFEFSWHNESAAPGAELCFMATSYVLEWLDDVYMDTIPSTAVSVINFGALEGSTISVYGLIAVALVFSDQISRLLYYVLWRIRRR